jgi:hypothetical protein
MWKGNLCKSEYLPGATWEKDKDDRKELISPTSQCCIYLVTVSPVPRWKAFLQVTEQKESLREMPRISTSAKTKYMDNSLGKGQLLWESGTLPTPRHPSTIRNTKFSCPPSLSTTIKSNSCHLSLWHLSVILCSQGFAMKLPDHSSVCGLELSNT